MDTRQPVHATTDWHALDTQQALDSLHGNPTGLAKGEIASRRQRYGANRLPPPRRRGPLLRLLLQFHNLLLYMMIAAAAVTALLGHWVDTGNCCSPTHHPCSRYSAPPDWAALNGCA